jgi:hypothetical protein
MGTVLPPDIVIRVLNPLITTGEFPVNQGAIKMLTKLVEQKSKEVLEPHLADVMPGLIKVSFFFFCGATVQSGPWPPP